ncbi:tryptophan synthase beta subunit-like PLP-dependent enzyme [Lanmaoa asiatica]|nr:tryptophan synthase beta subunit-like PLP-dependent enzyme [Lanmaoa asiatica]
MSTAVVPDDSNGKQPTLSTAYHAFPAPITSSSAGFDFHGESGRAPPSILLRIFQYITCTLLLNRPNMQGNSTHVSDASSLRQGLVLLSLFFAYPPHSSPSIGFGTDRSGLTPPPCLKSTRLLPIKQGRSSPGSSSTVAPAMSSFTQTPVTTFTFTVGIGLACTLETIPQTVEYKYTRRWHGEIRVETVIRAVDIRLIPIRPLSSSSMATSRHILDNALDAVGDTPLIRLDKIAAEEGLKCNLRMYLLRFRSLFGKYKHPFSSLVGKLEFMSAGGSVKDRVAKAMVLAAEKEGRLIPGQSIVIEPTSGNTGLFLHISCIWPYLRREERTGIGLAMTCLLVERLLNTVDKGYSVIITMPEKMSQEKEALVRALGAQVIRTPDTEPWDSPKSNIGTTPIVSLHPSWLNSLTTVGLAQRLQREIPHAVILDQFRNPNNPLVHEHTTGPEIIDAVTSTPSSSSRPSSMKVDAFIAGAGTGGTVTGISRALKKTHNSDCIVVGIDPIGSILAYPDTLNDQGVGKPYVVEGIGYGFIPEVLSRDPGDVDTWLKTADQEAFKAVQRLMKKEGLLVGGSSGSALSGALTWLKSEQGRKFAETEGMNVVVLLPDGIRNYMSKEWFLGFALRSEPPPLVSQSDEVGVLEASMQRTSL